ncbi:MAG TPA: family 16 glycoside hydrolase [Mycobacteriales bacterium]|nr:family 16 glycoside hydrolase [Mycobacteriales bacterium]
MPRFRSFFVALLAFGVWFTQSPAFASTLQLRTTWDLQALSLTGWADGSHHGRWTSTYNGYGYNGIGLDGTHVLVERPKQSLRPSVTHASLVTSRASYGDTDLTVRVRTVRQLRLPAPNPWEVGWTLWHYTNDTHFYYLVLKPNGWELGKEDPAYPGAQRYLRTGSSPTFAVGKWHTMHIRQVGNVITAWADGVRLASFTDRQRPYSTGHVGLYDEDSLVHFDTVTVRAP